MYEGVNCECWLFCVEVCPFFAFCSCPCGGTHSWYCFLFLILGFSVLIQNFYLYHPVFMLFWCCDLVLDHVACSMGAGWSMYNIDK